MSNQERERDIERSTDDEARPVNPNTSGHSQPTDVGRTSGGGSLGHDQPEKVKDAADLRNVPHNNTGSRRDPVMPEDDATLKTKI